jgi:hypothetical protein
MKEFGASTKIGKALRQRFSSIIKSMSASNVVGRLTEVIKVINKIKP